MGTCLLPTAQLVALYHLLVHVISFFFIHLVIKSIITFHVSFTGLNVQGVSNPREQCKRREMQLHLTALFWYLREDWKDIYIFLIYKLSNIDPMYLQEQGKWNLEEKCPTHSVLLGSPSKKLGFYPWQPMCWTWRESMNFSFSPNTIFTIEG